MKTVKIILIGLAIIIVIPMIIALFVKKDYTVERDIIVDKPEQEVFEYIKHLKTQDKFSKWSNIDPSMKKTYTGEDATVGFISAWDSQNSDVGKGEQEIKEIIEGERVEFELRFIKPFESTERAYMRTDSITENRTKLTWGFDGHLAYPMNLMLLFLNFEKMIGNDLAEGLFRLKMNMESDQEQENIKE